MESRPGDHAGAQDQLCEAQQTTSGSAGFEQYPGAPPRRADDGRAGLRARPADAATEEIVLEMRGLRQDLRGLSGAVRAGAPQSWQLLWS